MSAPRETGVARNTVYALLTQAVTALLTAGLTLYLVRELGPREYGLFSLALGVAGLLMLAADPGITASAARFIAERRGDRAQAAAYFADGARLKLLAGALVGAAMAAGASPLADAYGEPDLTWPLRGAALALFGQSMVLYVSQALAAMGRLKDNLGLIAGESVVEVSASIALVAAGGGAGGAAFGRAAGYVGGALLGLLLAARVFGRGGLALHASDRGRRAAIGRYAGALLVVNAAWALFTQIDILLIGAILGPAAVGVYSAPLRITTLLHYPGLALSNSVSPRVAGDSPDVATFVRALRLLVVLQAAMTVPIVVWAGPLVELLFDEGYGESADVLRAMAGYVFLFGIAPLISVSVNYLGEAKRRIPIALATVAVNVAIDLALLESMGPAAAGLATSVAFLIYVVGHLRIVQRLLGVPMRPLLATLAKAAAGAAAFTGVLLAVGTSDLAWWQWIAGLAGGGAAYLAVLAALGEHSLRDLTRLLRR